MIELHLPYPPTANGLWRSNRGRVHLSDKYKTWIAEAGWKVKAQTREKIRGVYKLSVQAVRPDRRRRDVSNLIKATEDLLVKVGVIQDDSLCEMVSARWVTQGEGIYVRIEPAGVE